MPTTGPFISSIVVKRRPTQETAANKSKPSKPSKRLIKAKQSNKHPQNLRPVQKPIQIVPALRKQNALQPTKQGHQWDGTKY